ncbi:MAG TPA: hypothetical protein PKA73_03625 [Pseudomonadales bacterium]|jgi:hypothetical protein|nr:hypothetical protein [Pseudomonadales bacterium]HMY95800.1 hypothetical protein [Pseudomonadales bacterium]HMZ90861.1 hypothetical protein [Pseudomonadales bacterium]HND26516.1 hypothetical protein [Pseudomonadales bacterium]HNF07699.1 hypothetical protein [Pseudomonadales bacterium]
MDDTEFEPKFALKKDVCPKLGHVRPRQQPQGSFELKVPCGLN